MVMGVEGETGRLLPTVAQVVDCASPKGVVYIKYF